jgi:hypothetical protein
MLIIGKSDSCPMGFFIITEIYLSVCYTTFHFIVTEETGTMRKSGS